MDKKAWLISVNMGYGHQRTTFALRHLAPEEKVINANDYEGILLKDKNIWQTTRKGYEMVSSFKKVPILGNLVFSVMDYFQRIYEFYPKRDLSGPSFQLKQTYSLIKKGWGKDLIKKLEIKNKELGDELPIVSTFFIPAFMAESFDYPGEIYCVVCDADISRAWAPLDPQKSRIKYLAPTERVVERLKLYGVKPENIFLTGYPLPEENIGGENQEILKEDLKNRILNLDPKKRYLEKYKALVQEKIGDLPAGENHLLTVTFCVGGAGAQKEIGLKILKNLQKKISAEEVKLVLVAGIKEEIKDYFLQNIKELGLENNLGQSLEVLFGENIEDYFQRFNLVLRKTDILWTKPSELSFFAALGLPIIIAPTIGSQEEFNKRWLEKSGFGIFQEDLDNTSEWLFDWLDKGYLAEAAMQGFVEGKSLGVINIEKIICG
jgi:hypothetical protein